MPKQPHQKLSVWQQFLKVIRNPISTLSDKSKDSPLITILAIVFILQPVLSSSVGLVKDMMDVKQSLSPGSRPVTKDELDIVNTKIDFIQQLIVTDMQKDAAAEEDRMGRRSHVITPPVVTSAPPPTLVAETGSPGVAKPPVDVVKSPSELKDRFVELNKRLTVVQSKLADEYKNAKK